MRIHGYKLLDYKVKAALANITKTGFSARNLANRLEDEGVPRDNGKCYISIDAASRIIRILKKSDQIIKSYGGGGNSVWKATNNNKKLEYPCEIK